MHQRTGAKLVIEVQVRAFREQMQIKLRQHRRKPIGILELDQALAEPHHQPIARSRIGHTAGEQSGFVNTDELVHPLPFVDDHDLGGAGQIGPHHRAAALQMPSQIAERIGVAALDDGDGVRRELAHIRALLRETTDRRGTFNDRHIRCHDRSFPDEKAGGGTLVARIGINSVASKPLAGARFAA
jgi:hypothetical protein